MAIDAIRILVTVPFAFEVGYRLAESTDIIGPSIPLLDIADTGDERVITKRDLVVRLHASQSHHIRYGRVVEKPFEIWDTLVAHFGNDQVVMSVFTRGHEVLEIEHLVHRTIVVVSPAITRSVLEREHIVEILVVPEFLPRQIGQLDGGFGKIVAR